MWCVVFRGARQAEGPPLDRSRLRRIDALAGHGSEQMGIVTGIRHDLC